MGIDAAIRQDQHADAGFDGHARLAAQLFHRALEAGAVFLRVVQQRQRRRTEGRSRRQVAKLRNLIVVEHGEVDLDLPARFGARLEQVVFGADRHAHRRDQLFANRIERRIGDLREQLLEVVVEQARLARQHRERGVGAHRANRLFAVQRHRHQQHAQVLLRVAECLLAAEHGQVIGPLGVRGRQVLDVDEMLTQPLAVRMLRGQGLFDFGVADDAAFAGIDQQHLARAQPILDDDVFGGDVEDADLRRHDDEIVLRDAVARRAQAVAIEHGADQPAVREGDRRRAVPGFHQRRVIFVERAHRRIHRRVAGPRLRDHHQHRVRQRAARHDQELEHVVEGRGVATARRNHRQHFLEVVAEDARLEQAFPRLHPVDVAAQRVDFAVVRDETIRMRERPRREGVGREALVNEGKRRFDCRV